MSQPLPNDTQYHCFVINVYREWSTKKWFATITKDAIRMHETERCISKADAIGVAGRKLSEL